MIALLDEFSIKLPLPPKITDVVGCVTGVPWAPAIKFLFTLSQVKLVSPLITPELLYWTWVFEPPAVKL